MEFGNWLPKGGIGIACCVTFLGMALGGCGGSSSGVPAHGGESQAVADFTAVVRVDVSTGVVTFTPSSAVSKTSRTVFAGPTMSMSSSILLTQAGTPGLKTTSVTLTNNSTLPIGVDVNGNVTGLRVLFGTFTITGGASTDPIELSNATGNFPSVSGPNVPYIVYPAQIAPNKTSPAQNWNFIVPSGVTAFSVPVTIEADNSYSAPPNGASGAGSPYVSVRTVAGSALQGFLNGTAAQARFDNLAQIAVDRAGDVYLCDEGNNCIRRVSAAGVVCLVAGSPFVANGLVNGAGTVARFSSPTGIAVTPDGSTVYVADESNEAIRRIASNGLDPTNPANWNVTTIAGTGNAGGNYASPTPGNTATFNLPFDVALDPVGNLVLTEALGNRVREMTFMGGDPSIAANWEVRLLGGSTSTITGATGDVDGASNTSTFNEPTGITVDAVGNCYVCDFANGRIRKITPEGISSTLAGGTSGSTVHFGYLDGNGASAQFGHPFGITVDSSGLIYEVDSGRVREISQAGSVTTIGGSSTGSQIDGPGNTAEFLFPEGIAVGASGSVYVSDFCSLRLIERINTQ